MDGLHFQVLNESKIDDESQVGGNSPLVRSTRKVYTHTCNCELGTFLTVEVLILPMVQVPGSKAYMSRV